MRATERSPDLRGFGASDKPSDVAAYGVAHTVADMVAVLEGVASLARRTSSPTTGARLPAGAWRCSRRTECRLHEPVGRSPDRVPQRRCRAAHAQLVHAAVPVRGHRRAVAARTSFLLAGHPDAAEVQSRLAEPGALTASLGWYRANAHPRSLIGEAPQLPPVTVPVLGIWSTGDPALTERQITESKNYVDASWRYENRGRRPLDAARRPRRGQRLGYWSSFSRNLRSSSRRNRGLRGLLDRLRVGGVHARSATRCTTQRCFLEHQREDDAECRERHCRKEHRVQCGVERVQEMVEQRRSGLLQRPELRGRQVDRVAAELTELRAGCVQ